MNDASWLWFEESEAPRESEGDAGPVLAEAFARAFRTPDGRVVLQHLMTRIQNHHLGPSASDAALRHLEGQRQLIAYLTAMIERGGGRVAPEETMEPMQKVRKRKSLWTRIF